MNRSIGPGTRAQELADEHPEVEWEFQLPGAMYSSIARCDVAYMSTSAEEPIVTAAGLAESVFPHRDPAARGLALVDISVPRNVATEVDALPGVFSYNVDDLKVCAGEGVCVCVCFDSTQLVRPPLTLSRKRRREREPNWGGRRPLP